jgi:hypothetical protein
MPEHRHTSRSEALSIGLLGCLLLTVPAALLLVPWIFALSSASEGDDVSPPEPEAFIDPSLRRANVVRAAAAVLAREHTPLTDGTPELVVVDVREGERWAWWSRVRTFDRGGRTTWRPGRLPDASLPADGTWHPLWSDGQIAVEWQNYAGTLVVREVRAAGAAVGLRTMVSLSTSFRGLHIPAGDLNDNAIFSGTAGMFVPDRWPRPLDATLLFEERNGEVVLDLTFGRW